MSRIPASHPLGKVPTPQSTDPFDTENRARRPVSDEARAKTIDFLSRLNRDGLVRETRSYENDELKENCYFSCSQTLQEKSVCTNQQPVQGLRNFYGRRAKREPDCLAFCYIRFKQAVDKQVAATKEEKKEEAFVPYWKKAPAPVDPNKAVSDEKYRISALDGKYLYKARGRLAIAKHAEDSLSHREILDLEKAQATRPNTRGSRAERLALLHNPLAPPPTWERLFPLTTAVSSRCARFEAHLIRIYSPVWGAMQRIPTMYADGSIRRTVGQLYEATVNGDGLVFGQKLVEQSMMLAKKWLGGSGGRDGSGGPGQLPPPPPALGPPTPPQVPPAA